MDPEHKQLDLGHYVCIAERYNYDRDGPLTKMLEGIRYGDPKDFAYI